MAFNMMVNSLFSKGQILEKIGKNELVNWSSNTLSQRSKQLTTVSALYTIAETLAIVVACSGSAHILNVAINANHHYNCYNQKENRWERILYCIAKQIYCTHNFIVLMILFIDFIY